MNLKPLSYTRKAIHLDDRSRILPLGKIEDVLVRVGEFTFPTDFYVVSMDDADSLAPIILGRPFMHTAHAVIDVEAGTVSMKSDGETMTFDCIGSTATSSSAASLCGVSEVPSMPNVFINCGTHKVELKFINALGNRPTYLTLEGTSSIPLKLQVTGEVTLSPTPQAKCGGNETPAIKKVKKNVVKSNEKKPKRMTTIEYRNKFRAKQPQQQWVVKTAQGEGRKKNEKISSTSSDDDKLSAGREATRHEGDLLSKEVPSTPT